MRQDKEIRAMEPFNFYPIRIPIFQPNILSHPFGISLTVFFFIRHYIYLR